MAARKDERRIQMASSIAKFPFARMPKSKSTANLDQPRSHGCDWPAGIIAPIGSRPAR